MSELYLLIDVGNSWIKWVFVDVWCMFVDMGVFGYMCDGGVDFDWLCLLWLCGVWILNVVGVDVVVWIDVLFDVCWLGLLCMMICLWFV